MAITRQTLQLLRRLRVDVGETADAATRDLTKAWVAAWDELHTQASAAVDELVAAAASAGRWPQPWELARMYRLQETLAAAEQALAQLGTRTGVTVTDAAGQVIGATVDHEPRLIASQLPAAEQVTAAQRFAARIVPQVVQVMVARTQAHIVNTARPLSADAMDAMRRELVAGVAVGDNPRTSARNMVDRVEGAFNGGLTRAMTIARTEILDAYRAASAYAHVANADVLSGWTWICACDRRSCFPAGTNITTRLGDVAIEDVREGDEVLTHAGQWRRAYEPMAQPYLGPMVIVEAGPLRVTATADHPFLIERQGKLNWVEAQYVRCGDRVLSHLQRVSNGIDHQFGEISVERRGHQSDHDVAARLEEQRLPGIAVSDLRMPVGFVDFHGDMETGQNEVDRSLPAVNSDLLVEWDPEGIKGESNVSLGDRLAGVSAIATDRTEAAAVGRNDADMFAAVRAVDLDRRSIALLGAMNAVASVDSEDSTASLTRPVLGVGSGASDGADDVSVGGATGNGESLVTSGAGFRYGRSVPPAFAGTVGTRKAGRGLELTPARRTLGDECRARGTTIATMGVLPLVGGIALLAAESAISLARPGGGDVELAFAPMTDTTDRRGEWRVFSPIHSGAVDSTELALGSSCLDLVPALLASPLHRYIVSRVDSHIQATIVYNFEVEGDHSYIANGIAVHNCPSCWSKHGSVYPVTTPGPWDHAQGRCARMPTVRPWSDLGINIPEPASTLPDAQARFWSLPATDRMAVMGPARLELLRTGAVDWSDLAARRTAAGWRDSFGPRSVRDLERIAASRRAAGIAPQPHPLAPAMAPAPKARPAPAPKVKAAAPTFPTFGSVGDLFMNDYTERKAVTAARRVAVEEQFNGEYAGLTVRVTEVQATDSAVAVDGKILHPDGRQVGLFTRAFYRDGDEIIAYHSLLDLDRAVQGQGFAEAFNRHLTDWYRRSGVDRIMLHANIDVGGYAWGRNGYDFAKAKDADKVLARLRGKVDAYRARTAGLVGDELAAMQRQIVAAEKILADGDRYEFGQVEYPSAYRISQAGRWDGAARDDMWIGKDAMLKSSWHGVKPL